MTPIMSNANTALQRLPVKISMTIRPILILAVLTDIHLTYIGQRIYRKTREWLVVYIGIAIAADSIVPV